MSDPLARFFTWPLIVERKLGTNTRGDVYAPPETVMCRIRMVAQMVAGADGEEVTTMATASAAVDTERVPPGSRVTLPPELSGRTGKVASEGVHDMRIPRTPAFYQMQITGG